RRAVLPRQHVGGPRAPAQVPRPRGSGEGRPLRRSAGHVQVSRHAHGYRSGALDGRQQARAVLRRRDQHRERRSRRVTATEEREKVDEVVEMRTVQRVILPLESDSDSLALYVEAGDARPSPTKTDLASLRAGTAQGQPRATAESIRSQDIRSRSSMSVRAGRRVSFGSYFNAFPAGYWRRWT